MDFEKSTPKWVQMGAEIYISNYLYIYNNDTHFFMSV